MYSTEIGSDNTKFGYHGYIALTVFVRVGDVRSGAVRRTQTATKEKSTGQNLLITTAQNKGAVGIPFQIHDQVSLSICLSVCLSICLSVSGCFVHAET